MWWRLVTAALLLVVGAPMLGSAEATFLGGLLVVVALAMLGLPAYLRRTRSA